MRKGIQMKNRITISIFSILSVGLQAFAGGSSTVGPGNPAAVNCIQLGGVLESYQTPAGASANCVIEQWQLYKEMSARGLTNPPHGSENGVGMPNPAAVNCIDIEGQLRTVSSPTGQSGFCVVEQWTLFRVIHTTQE